MRTHEQTVHSQFDPRAEAYLTSPVHAAGPDLEFADALLGALPARTEQALDIGCGGGHLAFRLAPRVRHMVALDPSPNMVATVARSAQHRGLSQIATCTASAESLPFADASFELVCTRYSAHHWLDLDCAIREMHRVLTPGGHLLIIDVLGADDALVDTHLQAMEVLRDASHVRDRSVREWRAIVGAQGLAELDHRGWPTRLTFTAWVGRMDTPRLRRAAVRTLQREAPEEVREALAIADDGSFTVHTGLFWLRKPV